MQIDDAGHATDSVDSEEPEPDQAPEHQVLEIHDGLIDASSIFGSRRD